LVLIIGVAFVIRAYFRNRRLGKAEFPPESPLLPPMESSSLSRISRSFSQRSGQIGGLGIDEKLGERYESLPQLSPLPPVMKKGLERDERAIT
jgi:hypothetical protein